MAQACLQPGGELLPDAPTHSGFRIVGVPCWVLIYRVILLRRGLYEGPLLSQTPMWVLKQTAIAASNKKETQPESCS